MPYVLTHVPAGLHPLSDCVSVAWKRGMSMKLAKVFLAIGATVVAFTSHDAVAEKCNGYIAMKRDPAIEIMKKVDGSQVLRIMNSRIVTVKEPKDSPLDGAYGT